MKFVARETGASKHTWSSDGSMLAMDSSLHCMDSRGTVALNFSNYRRMGDFDSKNLWLGVTHCNPSDEGLAHGGQPVVSARVFDTQTGAMRLEVPGYAFEAWCVAQPHMLLRSRFERQMQVWDVHLCQCLRTFPIKGIPFAYDQGLDATFSYLLDDRVIVCSTYSSMFLVDARSGVACLTFSESLGQWLLHQCMLHPDECSLAYLEFVPAHYARDCVKINRRRFV